MIITIAQLSIRVALGIFVNYNFERRQQRQDMGQRKLCPFDLVRQRRNGITDGPAEIDLGQVGVMETAVREIGFDTLRLRHIGFGKIDIMRHALGHYKLFER